LTKLTSDETAEPLCASAYDLGELVASFFFFFFSDSACSTGGVFSQAWSTSGIGLGSKSSSFCYMPAPLCIDQSWLPWMVAIVEALAIALCLAPIHDSRTTYQQLLTSTVTLRVIAFLTIVLLMSPDLQPEGVRACPERVSASVVSCAILLSASSLRRGPYSP
jgi:hypothetical protein